MLLPLTKKGSFSQRHKTETFRHKFCTRLINKGVLLITVISRRKVIEELKIKNDLPKELKVHNGSSGDEADYVVGSSTDFNGTIVVAYNPSQIDEEQVIKNLYEVYSNNSEESGTWYIKLVEVENKISRLKEQFKDPPALDRLYADVSAGEVGGFYGGSGLGEKSPWDLESVNKYAWYYRANYQNSDVMSYDEFMDQNPQLNRTHGEYIYTRVDQFMKTAATYMTGYTVVGYVRYTYDNLKITSGVKIIRHPVLDSTRSGSGNKTGIKSADSQHEFNDIIDNYAQYADAFEIVGGDNVTRKLYQIEGGLKSYDYKMIYDNSQGFDYIERFTKDEVGIFERMVDPVEGVTHRRFIPNGIINGVPNQNPN